MLVSKKTYDTDEEYINYFKKCINEFKPLAKLFRTDLTYYIYDTGTSKIMSCGEVEYEILEKIIENKVDEILDIKPNFSKNEFYEAIENIKLAIESEKILKSPKCGEFASQGNYENLYELIDKGLNQITLELTEMCNLRCGYCIYNESYEHERNFGSKNMTKEVAKSAIDYANIHGDKNKGIAITFYGGEPLLKFDLIKYCVEYAKKNINDKELRFSMTTNLTLMTPQIAEYLANIEKFAVVCSIDGPKEIHDAYRKDINGMGSFNKAIKGLKYLIDAFGDEAKDRISFSMVLAPPYSNKKLDEIQAFLNNLEWLPKEISKFVSYASLSKSLYKLNNLDENHNPLLEWSKEMYYSQLNNNENIDFFSKNAVEMNFLTIQNRPIYSLPNGIYPLNACCIPASRRLYITTDGNFMICEKINGSPIIGNVFSGVNKEKVKRQLIDEFSSNSIKSCSNCWAARLCNLCYASSYEDGKLNMKMKKNNCESTRNFMLDSLIFYHKCLENNPKKLEYLNSIKTS